MGKRRLFGIDVDDVGLAEAADTVVRWAAEEGAHRYVVTPNVDHLVLLERDPEFRAVYAGAALTLPDGMPLVWASRLLGRPLPARVTGADLFPEVCARAAAAGLPIFLLGGLPGVADRAADALRARHPALRVAGTYSPPFGFENDAAENERVVAAVNAAAAPILFVGLGAPKQEKWVARELPRLAARVALGVGAAFDFVAGSKRRAPALVRRAGFEFLWRFAQEPRRLFRRYFVDDVRFAAMVWRERRRGGTR